MTAERIKALEDALRKLLARDELNTCQHENTHRGGAIWEICEDCGAKWADDRGGKPTWADPQEWVAARAALAASRPAPEPVAWPHDEPRQIVCTGEEGSDVWNCAFGTWSADDFGMDSDETVGIGERLFVNRRLYDVVVARAEAAERALAASQPAPDCHQPDLVTSDSSQPAQPVAVAVKPLVWRGFVAGNYRIEVDKVGIAKLWRYSADIFESEEPELLRMGYLTLISVDDLKSAAQADYEARILAALEPQPLTVQDAARVVADGLADGEVWRVAVNGAAAILNSGMPESYWPPVKQIRETLDAALRAIAEGRA